MNWQEVGYPPCPLRERSIPFVSIALPWRGTNQCKQPPVQTPEKIYYRVQVLRRFRADFSYVLFAAMTRISIAYRFSILAWGWLRVLGHICHRLRANERAVLFYPLHMPF